MIHEIAIDGREKGLPRRQKVQTFDNAFFDDDDDDDVDDDGEHRRERPFFRRRGEDEEARLLREEEDAKTLSSRGDNAKLHEL